MPPAGTLYVVATPIGNLEDITLRALKVLKSVQLVAAEDTRRTGILLRHFDIKVPIVSVHEHNERGRVEKIAARLAKGESVALVTDAGTPGVSDPGATLVGAIRAAGFRIEPIPGASAVSTAISAAGINSEGFTFLGFPPIRGKDRKKWFGALAEAIKHRAVVFFEAPHKVRKTLEELVYWLNTLFLWRVSSLKLHEELTWGSPSDLIAKFDNPHGEFTVIIPPRVDAQDAVQEHPDSEVVTVVGHITETNY